MRQAEEKRAGRTSEKDVARWSEEAVRGGDATRDSMRTFYNARELDRDVPAILNQCPLALAGDKSCRAPLGTA